MLPGHICAYSLIHSSSLFNAILWNRRFSVGRRFCEDHKRSIRASLVRHIKRMEDDKKVKITMLGPDIGSGKEGLMRRSGVERRRGWRYK